MTEQKYPMTVPLTQDHIQQGVRAATQKCPAALAFNEHLGTAGTGTTVWSTLAIRMPRGNVALPDPALRKFIADYDRSGPAAVGPGTIVVTYHPARSGQCPLTASYHAADVGEIQSADVQGGNDIEKGGRA